MKFPFPGKPLNLRQAKAAWWSLFSEFIDWCEPCRVSLRRSEWRGEGGAFNQLFNVSPFHLWVFVFHFRYRAQATEITFIYFFSIFIMLYRLNELIVVFLLLSFQNRELQIMRRLEHCNIVKLKYFFYSSGEKVSLAWR